MNVAGKQFREKVSAHLANERLRRVVIRNTQMAIDKRGAAIAELDNWEELRESAYQIKRRVIEDLPNLLNRFEAAAQESGVEVFRAETAADATRIAHQIVQKHAVTSIVKAKSMVTEEIEFNRYFRERGYEVLETDLGEFIVQLAGERPSNLLTPAMHKSLRDVAKLFQEKLGVPYREDPHFLSKTARELLRNKFLAADMGVSGANFAVVENGSIVLVENEGNARMCYTLPPVHLAIIGMERLIPAMADLAVFLPLLCRSGTGQKITSYVSHIRGVRAPDELDGPSHRYFILVDNGRSRIREDEKIRESLFCIRCSACNNVCPVYRNIGGHAYGWVYQGPIGAVITPEFIGMEKARDLPFASSLCGKCAEVCPVKIPLPQLLLHQREKAVRNRRSPVMERIGMRIAASVFVKKSLFRSSWKLFRWLSKLWPGELPLPGWSRSRETPKPADQPFHDWWKQHYSRNSKNE